MQKFGFSKIDITPENSQYLAGYADRTEPSNGVADHIFVRASVFEDGNSKRLALISFDLIGTTEPMADEIYNRCQEKYGLHRNMIVINSIHTHCAPIVNTYYYAPDWKLDLAFYQNVIDSAVEAVGQALGDLSEASIRFGIGSLQFGINRRLPMNNDIYMCPNPNGFYLADMPVIQARRQGREDTVIYSLACHPTSRGGRRISADYPGAAAAQFKGNLQFVQGAAGSAKVRTLNEDGTQFIQGDDAWLEKAGKQIVDYLEAFLASDGMKDIDLDIEGRILRFGLPLDENNMFKDADLDCFYKYYGGDSYDCIRLCTEELRRKINANEARTPLELELRGVRLANGVRFLAISAEPTAELATVMMDAARKEGEKLFFLGYTGFMTSYLPSAKLIKEGGYEGKWANFFHLIGGLFPPEIDGIMGNAAKDVLNF